MKRWTRALTLVLSVLLLPAATISAVAPAPASPMTVGIALEPASLDPSNYDYSDNRFQVTGQVLETLVTLALDDSTPQPGLAESWNVSPNGLTWVFTLRSGVVFHDGNPLDAAAAAFNLERQWDPADPYHGDSGEVFASLIGGFKGDADCVITGIAATDTHDLTITLSHPFSKLPSILAMPEVAILSPASVVAGAVSGHPVGTGPFRFVSWTSGDNIMLDANPGHWNGAPRVSPLVFKIMADPAARLAALQANTIQVDADYPPAQASAALADGRLRVVTRPAGSLGYLGINRSHTPLNNPLVRQAIAHALNKPALRSAHYYANAQVATQILPPRIWGRDPTISDYDYDVAQAQALLASAGYPSGFSTTLATRDLPRIYLPDPVGTANAIKAALAAVGIDAQVLVYNNTTFFNELNAGNLDLFLLGWSADYGHPASFLNDFVCGDWAYFGPRDDELRAAMEEAEETVPFADQLAQYQWGSRRVHDTLPLIPLVHVGSMRVERQEVLAVRPTLSGWDWYGKATYATAWVYLPLANR